MDIFFLPAISDSEQKWRVQQNENNLFLSLMGSKFNNYEIDNSQRMIEFRSGSVSIPHPKIAIKE
ncbi:hypothetical protein ACZ76_05700 [Yersinia aleksiciae]|uniref:Uncharacterized protein n=1 Tax=Yersinia aleksiciae TaxID=263819 RepID=A0A0T9U715_YERAE|nr:hypothetical protein ACZ76_05700 [Yersinia aleksiciae]CFQ48555.1 Uncharacterised protein [Yersinia aleksiciae]CNL22864.1 Uncharacterised protein [Yersinia aleksiciae]